MEWIYHSNSLVIIVIIAVLIIVTSVIIAFSILKVDKRKSYIYVLHQKYLHIKHIKNIFIISLGCGWTYLTIELSRAMRVVWSLYTLKRNNADFQINAVFFQKKCGQYVINVIYKSNKPIINLNK